VLKQFLQGRITNSKKTARGTLPPFIQLPLKTYQVSIVRNGENVEEVDISVDSSEFMCVRVR